ncbi:FG-GAP-like repeat-containing protein [Stieleria sp. ICT_E10.1]|uniref:tetratricopeptide repeat protein n=1 Tax=Stieleria sedimenti TaxID=2976331 RepID=UPI0021807967|nr:tetratricopeptide repeat protein [Stieleria sedimenti]MCS7467722.1 FG-GAP-like repeat-containing protein [Stieleria sedimenti]
MNDTRQVVFLLIATMFAFTACDRSTVEPTDPSPRDPIVDREAETQAEVQPPAPVEKPFNRDQTIDAALALIQAGKTDAAAAEYRKVLMADPNDAEVLFRLARLHADRGNLADAVEYLDSIPVTHPEAGLPSLGQAADWYMQLERYDEAESRYQKVLELAGDVPIAHRQLAYLYNRQGRRHEAADHLRALCRLGNIQEDELHALMVLGHAIFDDPNKPPPRPRPNYPIGPAATARMLFTASRNVEAVEALDETVRAGKAVPSIVAFYGLLAIEAQDNERFQWWLTQTDQPVQAFAEYWAAIGGYLVSERRFEEAVRALGEALARDPTNVGAMRRINQALTALGQTEKAERWVKRYDTIRDVVSASNAIGKTETPESVPIDNYATIADGLDQLHRPLEAMTWRIFGAFHRKAPREEIESLNERRAALFRSPDAFASRQERVCGLDLAEYPLPKLEIPAAIDVSPPQTAPSTDDFPVPAFENIAESVGLNHTYFVASEPQPFRFALYQSLGGGIAVLDYDLDGAVDLYLAQGGADVPTMVGERSNQLYRGVDGKLVDRTQSAAVTDTRYSVGLGSGDWNQDGFADLVVANIGNKVLLINNGDGTFRRQVFDEDPEHQVLTSSVALGDITGDALPDLYALHYVEDPTMVNRPEMNEKGEILTISPASFQPGIDSIAVNDGRGGMLHQRVSDSQGDASTGLGVVIADWDGRPGNDIFVGNDIRANQLWTRSPDEDRWIDVAAVRGCALGIGGVETASMGIAVADFDGNGMRDIHITNFYLEPVSLFMNQGGVFEDRCVQYRLHRDSSDVLGFGCQALDYDLDGRPDLAVTNGNIEKAPGEPLEQSPQFFVNLGRQFRLSPVDDASDYWTGKYLGRGLARLDFNADGRQDMLISHIGSPSALLINRTATSNHWLTFQLVGTESERDAIGAQVEVHQGQRTLTNWIVGGDGYLCHNESTVSFGLGESSDDVKVIVSWPSGTRQVFEKIAVDQRLLLVEGQNKPIAQRVPPGR